MSSAALQSAPHQPTALASPPPPSTSNRQYGSPHTSPSREVYNGHQAAATSSPSSRRPPSRKTSGNRGPPPVDLSVQRSSRNGTNTSAQDQRTSRSERPTTMPPVAPPRTSSSGQQGSNTTRRNQYSNEALNSSPRHAQADGSRTGSRGDGNGYSDASRSKRATQSHQTQEQTRPSSSNRDDRAQDMSIPIRTDPATSTKHAHDASDNLARAISGAQAPNGRGSRHDSPDHHDAAPAPVIAMNSTTEERRGGRSRQDHSRSHKGTTKFGDFILGNTIGEGEFGKVKLGWKQDSSVQVCDETLT